jgi:hypothetical protein
MIFQQHARDCAEQFRVFEEERLRIEDARLIRADVSSWTIRIAPWFLPARR